MKLTITVNVTVEGYAEINNEYGQNWTPQALADQIAADIQQSPIGEAAGDGMTVSPVWTPPAGPAGGGPTA